MTLASFQSLLVPQHLRVDGTSGLEALSPAKFSEFSSCLLVGSTQEGADRRKHSAKKEATSEETGFLGDKVLTRAEDRGLKGDCDSKLAELV